MQSSNAIFITQPSDALLENGDALHAGLVAISQCASSLELISSDSSAVAVMRSQLPTFNLNEINRLYAPQNAHLNAETGSSKAQMLSNMPFSDGEMEKAWTSLCAFELDGHTWQPDNKTLIETWASIMTAASLRTLDFDLPIALSAIVGIVEEDGIPVALLKAVLKAVSSDGALVGEGKLLHGALEQANLSEETTVDKATCIKWVGRGVLGSESSAPDAKRSKELFDRWRELLPEGWRAEARPDFRVGYADSSITGVESLTANPQVAATDRKSSRKWHEKFKGGRRHNESNRVP